MMLMFMARAVPRALFCAVGPPATERPGMTSGDVIFFCFIIPLAHNPTQHHDVVTVIQIQHPAKTPEITTMFVVIVLLASLLSYPRTLVDGLALLSPSPSPSPYSQHVHSRRLALMTAVSDAALLLAMPNGASAAAVALEEQRRYQR